MTCSKITYDTAEAARTAAQCIIHQRRKFSKRCKGLSYVVLVMVAVTLDEPERMAHYWNIGSSYGHIGSNFSRFCAPDRGNWRHLDGCDWCARRTEKKVTLRI